MRRVAASLLLIAAVAGVGVSGVRLEQLRQRSPGSEEMLYLPNGKHLAVASLGQSAVLADLIYLWAIQFYADYAREDRFRYVEHVFGEVIAELDPQYIEAYWMGALIMSIEGQDLDGALRLLDLGIERNPDAWVLSYLAGWECALAGRTESAYAYFDRASSVPGAPLVVKRLRAGMKKRNGDVREALRLWYELIEEPDLDEVTRAAAGKQIRELKVRADVADLQSAVQAFRNENDRWPRRLAELLGTSHNGSRSYVRALPLDPDGRPYLYDPRTGDVQSAAGRLLGGS